MENSTNMEDINTTISIITLNINGLKIQITRQIEQITSQNGFKNIQIISQN